MRVCFCLVLRHESVFVFGAAKSKVRVQNRKLVKSSESFLGDPKLERYLINNGAFKSRVLEEGSASIADCVRAERGIIMYQRPRSVRRPRQTGPNVKDTPQHPAAGFHVVPSLRLPLRPRQALQLAGSLRGEVDTMGRGNSYGGLRTQCVYYFIGPSKGQQRVSSACIRDRMQGSAGMTGSNCRLTISTQGVWGTIRDRWERYGRRVKRQIWKR